MTRHAVDRSVLGWCLLGVFVICFGGIPRTWSSLPSETPDFPAIIAAHGAVLSNVESDKAAVALFVSTVGPALGLNDAAKTLGAKALPTKVSNELLIPDLTTTAQRLIGSLAAWQFATQVRRALSETAFQAVAPPDATRQWMVLQGGAWAQSYQDVSVAVKSLADASTDQNTTAKGKVSAQAAELEIAAIQSTYQEWNRLQNWKQQVRTLRGQGRLCGTWHWVIHNHQKQHHEQKLSLHFPPPGSDQPNLPGLVETIVLGDNVYLRWETDGQVQEDSLQFVKEGHRLEGTFVNSQGGWGSISGKRTAACALAPTPEARGETQSGGTVPDKQFRKIP